MTLTNLEVRVRLLEAKTAQLEAKKTQRAIAGIGSTSRKAGDEAVAGSAGFDVMTGSAKRLRTAVAFVGGAAGFGSLLYGMRDAIRAGEQWQTQQAQLRNALKNTGQAGAGAMDMLDRAIAQTSTHGGFTPQEEAQGLAQFIRLTGSSTKAIRLNREALALARGANLGYTQALRFVSQAQTGTVGRMGKYVGAILPVTKYVDSMTAAQKRLYPQLYRHMELLDKMATAQEINTRVMQRYSGATTAYSQKAAGAISNAEHAFDLLAEQIGRVVLPIVSKVAIWLAGVASTLERNWPGISRVIRTAFAPLVNVVKWLIQTKTVLEVVGAAVGVFATYRTAVFLAAEASKVFAIAQALAKIAVVAFTEPMAILNTVMEANPFVLVATAIAALAAAIVIAYTRSKTFRAIVTGVFSWLRTAIVGVVNVVTRIWRGVLTVLEWPFTGFPKAVVGAFNAVKHIITGVVNWIWGKFTWLGRKISGIFGGIGHFFGHTFSSVGHFFGSLNPFHSGGLVRRYAPGGFVPGVGDQDSIPAMLTPGEFVLRKEVVNQVGVGALNALNGGRGLGGAECINVQIEQAPIVLRLGPRVLAEGITQTSLKKAAFA